LAISSSMTLCCFRAYQGLVLEKIWRTYVELFERALADARATLKKQKERTSKLEAELVRIQNELEELKARHPQQLSKLRTTLTKKQGELK
ncbi:unnamed protein product, partial [Polarella glacialis]